jgi:hypothetical protein
VVVFDFLRRWLFLWWLFLISFVLRVFVSLLGIYYLNGDNHIYLKVVSFPRIEGIDPRFYASLKKTEHYILDSIT